MNYLSELLYILNEMSPYLILGLFISGILHVYMPKSFYSRFLGKRGVKSVVNASLLGVPLPLCSCGVIPTAISLKKEGGSDGAMVSFLVSTPQTGVDSILATYSLLGLPFAIIRPVASFFIALFSGVMVDMFGKNKEKPQPQFTFAGQSKVEKNCGCSCDCKPQKVLENKPQNKFLSALQYGFIDMMQDFGKWLIIGLLVAAAITAYVPESLFEVFKDHYILNILLILVISIPMYICATGSIPIALSLMMKGLSPGAAFVLMMAGPVTNFASLLILKKEIGLRKTVIYLISILLGAITCAVIIDFVMPQEWFANLMINGQDLAGCSDADTNSPTFVWWEYISSAIFVVVYLISIITKMRKSNSTSCCL